MKDFFKLIGCIFICELVGLLAVPFTISQIPSWYSSLNKPFFSPPNWIFGPVWTILYILMGISLFLVLKKAKRKLTYFFLQLGANFLWSVFFFGIHSPRLAFADLIILFILIILTIKTFYKTSKSASYLLIPYLLWVTFAGVLNFSILILNP